MPKVYRSPLDEKDPENHGNTSYLLFAGKGSVFEDPNNVRMADITDGTSNTIALAEVNNSGVFWTQPTDLDAEQLDFIIRDMQNARPGQLNTASPDGTVNVGFFDGSVRALSPATPPAEIRSAVNPRDNRSPMLE
jgi:prepilin-type processing-associated H-X9-DG protein